MEKIIYNFLKTKDLVQIYHWQTKKHSRHVAAGTFYKSLDEKIDRFVETMQKKKRFNFKVSKNIQIKNVSDDQADKILIKFLLGSIGSIIKILASLVI